MTVPLHEILDELLPAPEGDGSEDDNAIVASPHTTYYNRNPAAVGGNKTPRIRRLMPYKHPAELITLDDDEEDTTGDYSDDPVAALNHHLHPHYRLHHHHRGGGGGGGGGSAIMAAGGVPHVTYNGAGHHAHKRVLPMLSVASTVTGGSESVTESPRGNDSISQHRVVAHPVSSTHQHHHTVQSSYGGSFSRGNCSTSTSAGKDETSCSSPRHRREDDDTTMYSYAGAYDKAVGLGPHVVKTLAEAYEAVCRDLAPHRGGNGAERCASLHCTPVAGPLGSASPPPFAGLLALRPAVSIASSSAGMDVADTAALISDDLAALSHERLTSHCTELHLILLRLLELSRSQKHAALSTMRSMASLSPQVVAPVQTTHTVDKQVDADGIKSINGYTMLHELGRGSCAKVKLAFDSLNSRMVAIKIVRRVDLKAKLGGQTQAQAQFQSLQREIAVMKKLRHKNVVSLYEVIDDPEAEKLYLVMQYIDHGPMTTMINGSSTCNPIPSMQLLVYARHIFAGLMYLHQHNIVHRDVKLENVLVSKDGVAYLADFGVSEVFGLTSARRASRKKYPRQTIVEGQKGTVLYMAPELLHDGLATNGSAVDIWAAGVTLFAALTGKLPFASVADIVNATTTLVMPKEYGKHWERLLRNVLSFRPEDRFTAMEAHAEVRRMLRIEELRRRHRFTNNGAACATNSAAPLLSTAATIHVEDNDIDCAFTPVFAGVQHQNSMLQERRFCAADLLGSSSSLESGEDDEPQYARHDPDDADADSDTNDNNHDDNSGKIYTVPTPPLPSCTSEGAASVRRQHAMPQTTEERLWQASPQEGWHSKQPSPEPASIDVRVPHRPVGT